eukprot:6199369-Pleurochrysis_carterae.AAC.1
MAGGRGRRVGADAAQGDAARHDGHGCDSDAGRRRAGAQRGAICGGDRRRGASLGRGGGRAPITAQAADEGAAEQAGDAVQRIAAAGRACSSAALRDVLDALGADGTLG